MAVTIIFSCSKDESRQDKQQPNSVNIELREQSRDPFFDIMYTHDSLNVGVDQNGYYPYINNYMIDLSSQVTKGSFFDNLKNQSIYPCWYCGESEYIGFENYYIPFYDLEDTRLDGILIIQEKENLKGSYYLSHALVKQIVFERDEPYSEYWNGIMDYFDGGTQGKDKKDHFNSRTEKCKRTGVNCKCNISFTLCGEIAPNGILDCIGGTCSGDDGNGSGGDPTNDDGGPLDHSDINNWIDSKGDTGGGGGSVTPSTPAWDDFCGGFNGSLAVAGGDITGINDDGSIDIAITDAVILYEIQLNNFINAYGLQSEYTPETLMDFVGEECAVSNIDDVFNCLKCHFISPLGLSDEDNCDLLEDFDIIADCVGDPNPSCVDCGISLKDFILEYELMLTPQEKEAIIMGISTSSCGTDEFNDLTTDFLMEECLGAFYSVLEQMENLTNQEKLEYCNSELPEIDVDPPGCEGCSVGEAQIVWGDEIKALNMLDCAIDKLEAFNGSTPDDVKQALANHFGGTSSTFVANYIKFLFEHVRRYPYERGYQAQDQGEGLCGASTDAWTLPAVHSANVRLCRPRYWNEADDVERAGTLIHEWMHLYYFAGDIAYDWESSYSQLNTIQQLFNADAFSEFVKEICDE